eukprot:COSAG04_NODE_1451_length_6686_cov_13.172435_7_plen_158_part_00
MATTRTAVHPRCGMGALSAVSLPSGAHSALCPSRSTSIFLLFFPDACAVRLRPYDILRLDQMSGLLEIFYTAERHGPSCATLRTVTRLCAGVAAQPLSRWAGFLVPRDSARPLQHNASPFIFRQDARWSPSNDLEKHLPELGILLGPVALAAPSCKM